MSTLHNRGFGPALLRQRRQWIEWLLFAALAAAMWIMLPVGSAGAA